MAPSKKKGGSKAAAFKQFRLGDLVLAKVKGFPAWPAKISRPEEWHQPHDPKKVFVYFYGTEEIGYCVPSDVQIFSVDLRNKILAKCRGKASSDFIRAVEQICAEFDDSMRGRQEKSPKTDNDKPHMGFDIAKESNEKLQLPETFVSDSISKCQKSQSVKHDICKEKKEKQLLKPEFTQDNQRDKMDESASSAKRDLSMTNETNVGDVTPTRWRSAKADHNKPMSKPQKRIGVFEEDKSQGMVTEPQMKRMKRDIKGSSEMRGHCLDDYNTSQNVTNENEQHDINTSSVELVSKHNDKFAQPFQEDARLFKEIKVTSELVDDKELQQSIANNNTTDSETIRSKSLQQSITNNITTDSEAVRSNSLGEKLQVLDTDPNAQENLPDDKQGAFVGDDKDASSNEDKPIEEKRNPNCFLRHNPITKRKRKSSKKHTPDAVLQDMPGDSDQKKSNISPQENAFRVFPGTDYRKKRTQLKARKERPNMDEGPSSSIQFKERSQRLSLETSPSEAQQNTRKPRPEMPQGPHTGAHIKEKKQGSNLDDRLPKGPKMKARKSSSGVLEVTSSRAQLKSRKQKSDLPDGSLPSIQPKTQRPDSDEFLPLPKKQRLDSSADGTSETNMLVKNDVMSCEMHLKVNDSSNLNRTATDKTFLNIDKSSPPVEKNSLLPPKADKYCLRCNLPGDETALPPSKRRYRAQEAMSACVAEAASASEGQEVTGIPVTDNTTGSCESSKMVAENVVSCNLNYDSFIGRDTRQMPDDENKNSYTKESMEQTSIQHDTSEHAQKRMDNSLISSPKKQVKSGLYFQHCDSVSLSPNKLIIAERNASEQNENKAKGSKLKKPVISLKKNVGTAKNQLIDTEKPSQEHIPNHLSGSLFSSKKVIASSNPKTKLNGLKSEELISPHVEKGNNIKPMLDVAKKSRDISKIDEGEPTKSLKHLLAAAQARRREQVRSAALTNPPGKEEPETLIPSFISSPSPTHQSSSPQSSPSQFNPVHMVPEDTKANFTCGMQKVPGANIHSLNTYGAEYAIQEETNGGTFNGDTEAAVARDAFEGMLETLSRTKESIGRASRHAIDCAKYGMASEIIELLIQRLETESSFHRRIDLFFLVDSITQCSHSQKGIASASYIPVVQAALPRILSAAAPRGSVARENRRQCLKVLRLWLERKILPESVLRKYMSEFGSINDERHSNFLSRRPARSERAVDDPVREIEGMLDEYGSNATFQLPGFLMQNIFDDEETPESDTKKLGVDLHADAPRSQEEPIKSPGEPVYKHRHILEDVDGELEMEDASPSQVYDTSSQQNASGEGGFSQTVDPHGSFPPLPPSSPPLPCETPPSPPPSPPPPPPPPPPLPESPPPPPPSSPPPPLPSSSPFGCPPSLSQPYTKAVNDSNFHMLPGNVQQQSNHVVVPGASHNPHVVQQMQSNNANMSFAQQSYCPPPPTLPPSTQFSFVRPEIQHPMQQVWMDCSPIHDQEMTSIHEDRWRLVNNERGRWMQDQLSTQRAAAPGIFWPSGTAPYPPMMQHPAQKPIVPSGSIHPTMGNIGGAPANHLVSQTNPARPGLSAMNSWRHG